MMRRRNRNVQILSLFCAMFRLTMAFPALTPPTFESSTNLQVKIPFSDVMESSLGSSVALPCFVSLSSVPSSIEPRVKWTVVSGGVEQQIIVARGERVKVDEAFKGRATLQNYSSSPDDVTLLLSDVRSSDSGHYRCEVQQGLEDANDLVQLEVKGVVFHYRDAMGRYAFSFPQAQKACEAIGAEIATPDHLLAAYHDGYEQCDAGWLADQSVRYPIQLPREGCYGDMDGRPGVRNYGTMDPNNLYDVYCFINHMDGEVFFETVPQQVSFPEAQAYCGAQGAELASTAQLYLAWSEGLDRCSPGWLSDGSVRYPIVTPRERCGGSQSGVKTVYQFSNQTGFPEPTSLHDVYCFRGKDIAPTASAIHYTPADSKDIEESIVILTEKDQELQLHRTEKVEREALSFLESFSLFSAPVTEKTPPLANTTESSHNTTAEPDVIDLNNATSTEIYHEELEEDSLEDNNNNNTLLENGDNIDIEESVNSTFDKAENETVMQHVSIMSLNQNSSSHNETKHFFNSTFEQNQLENTTGFVDIKNETAFTEEPTELAELEESMQTNDTEVDSSEDPVEKVMMEVTNTTAIPTRHQEESKVEEPVEISLTEAPETGDILTEPTQALTSSTEEATVWISQGGSGDESQEIETDATTLKVLADSSTLDSQLFSSTPAPSDVPSITPTHDTVLNLTISPAKELIRQNESVEYEDAAMVESEEIKMITTNSDNLLDSSVSFGTTDSPEVFYSSMKPNYREYLGAVTDAFQEASGQEPETVTAVLDEAKPTLEEITPTSQDDFEGESLEDENAIIDDEENIHLQGMANSTFDDDNEVAQDNITASSNFESKPTEEMIAVTPNTDEELLVLPTKNGSSAFSIDSQTYRTSITTTTRPHELEYERKTSTLGHNSPKTTTARPYWTRRTPLTTAVPKVNHHETSSPQTVTVHIPPVDTGRADHKFSLTPPPSLHILPVERAAIGGTGKISDGCLNDPCKNGGTCTDQNGQIKCLCLPTYGGDLCQNDLELCEVGWDKFQGFCYRHFGRRLNWDAAEQHCRTMGAHLVSIMSPEEQGFIMNFYKEYQWTGLNDKAIEKDFRWSDGNPLLYENWYKGQPDSYFLSGEDCVVMVWHDNGRWSDVPCNYNLAYTCKKGTSSCGPPPKVRNASIFGKIKPRYSTNAAVRYHCSEGFQQRLNPLVRCLSGGKWERPQIQCIPENGSLIQFSSLTSTNNRNLAAIEDEYDFHEFETPKEIPPYWDIKF